jgi:non-ribosomal peptide synthetase component F
MKSVAPFESQLAYWQERLAGATVVELPTDRRRAGVAVPGRAWVPVRLDREVTDRLADLVRREGLGLDVALFAAFIALQHRYTDQDDLVVGSLGVGGAPSVGDPVPVRLDVARDVTGRTFMAQVGDVVTEALDHGDISFHDLVKDLQPRSGPARRPLYQTLFL